MAKVVPISLYPRGESNPYRAFRKRLFYPLNYKGSFQKSIAKVVFFIISANIILSIRVSLLNL